jgi:hypothetical protein
VIIESRGKWAGHIARMEEINIFIRTPLSKITLGSIIMKRVFEEDCVEVLTLIKWVWVVSSGERFYNTTTNFESHRNKEFLDQPTVDLG